MSLYSEGAFADFDKKNMPIVNMLKAYAASKGTIFHMPGHKQGRGISQDMKSELLSMDITELSFSDNLHSPEGVILEAQKLAAKAYGAKSTFFLVNGSTGGIHAAIMSVLVPGESILVARNCHSSIIGALMLAGGKAVYVMPKVAEQLGVSGSVTAEDVELALEKNPEVVGMVLVSPTYYGICSDVKSISEVLHKKGKLLIVDEAHGAHLCFSDKLPHSALSCGADISVQSAHKTLPAITPGAMLHIGSERVDIDKLEFCLRLLQTTSPSYLVLAFLDYARLFMQTQGADKLDKLVDSCKYFYDKVGFKTRIDGKTIFDIDPTRLVVNTASLGKTGFFVEKILALEYNIYIEMADVNNILCIATISDYNEDIMRLADAVREIISNGDATAIDTTNICGAVSPATIAVPIGTDAYPVDLSVILASKAEKVELKQAVGKVSKDFLTPYPPGIPLVCPGEVILQQHLEYIDMLMRGGGKVLGIDKAGKLRCI